jgi:hypothetical protein
MAALVAAAVFWPSAGRVPALVMAPGEAKRGSIGDPIGTANADEVLRAMRQEAETESAAAHVPSPIPPLVARFRVLDEQTLASIAGASIVIEGQAERWLRLGSARTDREGSARIAAAPGANRRAVVSAPGYLPRVVDVSGDVTCERLVCLAPGSPTTVNVRDARAGRSVADAQVFVVPHFPARRVTGDTEGRPLAEVRLGEPDARTDGSGRARLTLPRIGHADLIVVAPGYAFARANLVPGGTDQIEVALTAAEPLQVQVFTAEGAETERRNRMPSVVDRPLASARVALLSDGVALVDRTNVDGLAMLPQGSRGTTAVVALYSSNRAFPSTLDMRREGRVARVVRERGGRRTTVVSPPEVIQHSRSDSWRSVEFPTTDAIVLGTHGSDTRVLHVRWPARPGSLRLACRELNRGEVVFDLPAEDGEALVVVSGSVMRLDSVIGLQQDQVLIGRWLLADGRPAEQPSNHVELRPAEDHEGGAVVDVVLVDALPGFEDRPIVELTPRSIELAALTAGGPLATASLGADGTARLSGLAAGAYLLTVRGAGPVRPRVIGVTDEVRVEIEALQTARVGGRVLGGAGRPLVRIVDPETDIVVAETVGELDGSFSFPDAPCGRWLFFAVAAGQPFDGGTKSSRTAPELAEVGPGGVDELELQWPDPRRDIDVAIKGLSDLGSARYWIEAHTQHPFDRRGEEVDSVRMPLHPSGRARLRGMHSDREILLVVERADGTRVGLARIAKHEVEASIEIDPDELARLVWNDSGDATLVPVFGDGRPAFDVLFRTERTLQQSAWPAVPFGDYVLVERAVDDRLRGVFSVRPIVVGPGLQVVQPSR